MWIDRLVLSLSAFRAVLLAVGLAVTLLGCQRQFAPEVLEVAYVSGSGVYLRNELGPSSRVEQILEGGERVEILDKRPRWAQVRLASGLTGWIQQRFLVSRDVFDQFHQLDLQAEGLPSQGRAVVRRGANLHLEPGRSSLTFYQLAEGEGADVVAHGVAERPTPSQPQRGGGSAPTGSAGLQVKSQEDWLLVRAARGRAGWLLETSADLNPPIEIAQYHEGLRIRAWFEIYREKDQGQERPWYLWATIRRLAGLPYDFDEIRVFVWNPKMSRYETSYRERNLIGFFPIQVESLNTPDGPAPAFHLQLEDEKGQRHQKNYFMVGRQVRVER